MIESSLAKTHTILVSSKQLSNPNFCAEVDRCGGLMVLNPSKDKSGLNEFLSTFVHECLHILLKTGNEKVISRLERRVYADMSACDKQNLLAFLAKNSVWDD